MLWANTKNMITAMMLDSLADAVAAGRKIVGHFKHSALAFSRLDDIQVKFNQPLGRLHQDVQTHWNGMYRMLQSPVEQKRALGVLG